MSIRAPHSDGVTLVVGDRALASLLERGPDVARANPSANPAPTVISVDHYLDALGEMANQNVQAVIGRLDPMASTLESTIDAIRSLSNGARLILVVDASQEPQARRALQLGYDDYVVRPFEEAHIWAALEGQKITDLPATPDTTPATPDASATPATSATSHTPASPPFPDLPTTTITQPPLTPQDCDDLLGDVDLVEQLLRNREGLKPKALYLMSQRLGGEGLSWSTEPDSNGQSCPVQFAGQQLGYLTGQSKSADQLKVYAAWLARWLMLERQLDHLNDLALKDDLTGVWNRRYFNQFLNSTLLRAKQERFRVTVMIYDIDDFKDYNDAYGHSAGDEILRETASLMTSVIRDHDIVARIGGDEFAVIFWDAEESRKSDSEHPQTVRSAAKRFRKAICQHRFPKLADEAPGTLTISGGLASYPWDGATADELMEAADRMLLESKAKGKNAMTFGPGAMRLCQVNGNGEQE